jgi:hypothetical protein
MKAFVVVCLCGLSSVMLAAQSKPRAFTDPDGNFQFKYSPVLVQCNLEGTGKGQPFTSVATVLDLSPYRSIRFRDADRLDALMG